MLKNNPVFALAKLDKARAHGFAISLILLGLVCASLAGHFAWHQFAIGPEAALRLSEAQLINAGAVPYVDFYDNAAPTYLYLNLLPVWLAKISGCHPILFFNELNVLVLFICGSLLIWLGQLEAGAGPHRMGRENIFGRRRNLLALSFLPVLIAYLLVVVLRLSDFGANNQLLFMAATPYIALRALRRRGLRVPRLLALACAVMLCLSLLTDLLFLLGFALFEAINLLSFAPFPGKRYLAKRFFGDELILAFALIFCSLVAWWLLPNGGQNQYLSEILPLYLAGFSEIFGPLRYAGNGSDLRPDIFLSVFLLVLAAPFAARNVLSRLFAVAGILSFGLMIAWSACLYYQSFGHVAFTLLAFAACLRMVLPPASRAQPVDVPSTRLTTIIVLAGIAVASVFYLGERIIAGESHTYRLSRLGLVGSADSRDLGPMSEALEASSKPRDKVGVVALGVRPAFPSLTQLNRRPGLALTWGFPIMTYDFITSPDKQDEVLRLTPFKQKIFSRLAQQLADKDLAPKMVAIEEGETKTFLEQTDVLKKVAEFYKESNTVPLFDESESNASRLKEFIGYKNCVTVFIRKP